MRPLLCPLCGVFLLALGLLPDGRAAQQGNPDPKADLQTLVQGNNEFAFDMYRRLAEKEKGNLIFSPYSISTALAMTYAGARSETAEQMAKVLHFTLGQERLHSAFGELARQLSTEEKKPAYQLYQASALWGQRDFNFRPDFLRLMQANYGAGLRPVDFKLNTEAARQQINGWVEEQTRNKVRELVKSEDLSSQTRLVLTNAVYFQAAWERPFAKEGTKEEVFWLTTKDKVNVSMMHHEGYFQFLEVTDLQMLALPYRGGRLSMVVFLPKSVDGLAKVETALTASSASKWFNQLQTRPVAVVLPKFRFDAKSRMKTELSDMGMPLAFQRSADFSGAHYPSSAEDKLWIGEVLHEAHISLDEQGTEATAATAVLIMGPSGGAENTPVSFRVDHPFLFLIRDNTTKSILFIGKLTDIRD